MEQMKITRAYNFEIRAENNEKNGDFWRVFGVKYSPEALDSVAVDNSLKRKVYDHLKSGGNMGYGVGIIIVDENY